MSAGNYMKITDAPPATATRDLTALVGLGVLLRTGENKATRYRLNVKIQPAVAPER
uniref:Filamentation induced by cAMP protein Fic n=1 Tax=Caulobacter sp. (strain K31) TaxID=366602 RepID=B0T411_CAUSK